jgi:hypothetical protein
MAMDDPWGSPWADETQTPHPIKLKENGFAFKPTTPVKAASLALEQKTSSPWDDADDDGFGEWAVGTPEKKGKGLGLDGADDGWTSNVGDGPGYGFTIEDSHALSGSLDNDTTISDDRTPTLGLSLLPKSSGILRQPSPDPWAMDTNQEDELAETLPVTADRHHKGGIAVEPMLDLSHDEEITQVVSPVVVEDGVLLGTIGIENSLTTTNGANIVAEESSRSNVGIVETLTPIEVHEQNGDIQEAQHVPSRPSSSPSEHSRHDDTTQDSPRTSLDEEPKRPSVAKKVSTKIQELVEHFDGLAKQEEIAVPIAGRIGSPARKTEDVGDVNEDEEEMDDFGDFENVQSETDEPIDERRANPPPKSPIHEDSKVTAREPEAVHEVSRAQVVPKDIGPVEFTVDATVLDRIYSQTEAKPPPEKVFIPEVGSHDSFSSTEERKTWYRISRYGTMRKYNTGGDENYVRVNWTQSQVRAEILKTVARWIEEDRISGRVVLGGASKGSSIFGWNDSKAAPVPLAAAFAVNNGRQKAVPAAIEPVVEIPREWPKGLVRTRSTSRSPSLSKARRKSSTKSITTEDAKPQLPVANFGWNAAAPSVQDSKPQSPVHKKNPSGSSSGAPLAVGKIAPAPLPTASRVSSPLAGPTKRDISMNGTPPRSHSNANTSVSIPPFLNTSNITNGDDGWGELVSSPSTNFTPAIPSPSPSPSKSLHKTTGNLGSAFPQTAPTLELTSVHFQPLKVEQTVDWASNFNESLSLVTTNSTTINTTDTFSQDGFTTSSNDYMGTAFSPNAQAVRQPTTAVSVDPWASADFSFFESSTASVSKPTNAPMPKSMPKSVTFSTSAVTSIPPQNPKSREEIEQDRIVQSVVKGLPDLSYMLRK